MMRSNVVIGLLLVIAIELGVIALRFPPARVQAQSSGPVPVVIVNGRAIGNCPMIVLNWCLQVEDSALAARLVR